MSSKNIDLSRSYAHFCKKYIRKSRELRSRILQYCACPYKEGTKYKNLPVLVVNDETVANTNSLTSKYIENTGRWPQDLRPG